MQRIGTVNPNEPAITHLKKQPQDMNIIVPAAIKVVKKNTCYLRHQNEQALFIYFFKLVSKFEFFQYLSRSYNTFYETIPFTLGESL